MPYIFISYSSKNQASAEAMRKILKSNNIQTWMAPHDIPVGEKYASVINKAIKNCTCFMLLLTNEAQSSKWVPKEIERAINYGKTIIPVRLDDVVLNDEFEIYISTDHLISLPKVDVGCDEMKSILRVLSIHIENEKGKEPIASFKMFFPSADNKTDEKADKGSSQKQPAASKPATKIKRYGNGDVYEGEMQDGKKHGKGKYTGADGRVYEGEWEDDVRNGYGKMTYADGDIYEGDWANGQKHGKGKYTWANGAVYEGDWKDGNRRGYGKYTWADGGVYEGDWKDDKRNGYGKTTYADGNIYEGDWKDDKRNGYGKMTYADGNIYEGDWANGQKQGKGKYTWANGAVYEGDWANGQKHGKGKYTWADGRVYEGDWKDDKRNGYGKMTYADGSVKIGTWENGKFIG